MEGSPLGFMMAFLLPFHLIGGAALGAAIRGLFEGGFEFGKIAQNGFLLIWGAMFGGIPFVFGLTLGSGGFLLLELAVFFGALVTMMLFQDWLRDLYSHPGMSIASFGLVFFLIGVAFSMAIFGGGDADGALMGLIFAGVGGILLVAGVLMLLRTGVG